MAVKIVDDRGIESLKVLAIESVGGAGGARDGRQEFVPVVQRTQKIDKLIVNSPYVEPTKCSSYRRESRLFTRPRGGDRRPCAATEGSRAFDDPGRILDCHS